MKSDEAHRHGAWSSSVAPFSPLQGANGSFVPPFSPPRGEKVAEGRMRGEFEVPADGPQSAHARPGSRRPPATGRSAPGLFPGVLPAAALALLTGCPPKVPPEEVPLEVDPMALLARALGEPAPGPSAATFDLRLESPDQNVNANGALVVSPPNRFRIEVRGPIGPPQLVVVSDGVGVTAWLAGKNELITATDADQRIRGYTDGEVGLEALASLLLGRLPASLKQPDLQSPGPTPAYRWEGPGESHLDVGLDPRSAHLARLALADELGATLLEAAVEGKAWPDELQVRIPSKGVTATLDFGEWRGATPDDSAFVLTPPEGATVRPLDLSGAAPAPASQGPGG